MENELSPGSALLRRKGALTRRRAALTERLEAPALIFAGAEQPRNYAANTFPLRASSHFLYLVGEALQGAVLALQRDREPTLFRPDEGADAALWHGPSEDDAILAARIGCAVRPLHELTDFCDPHRARTLPVVDARTLAEQSRLLGRPITPGVIQGGDAELADALIRLRLAHDEDAVAELRLAAEVTTKAHLTGMRVTRPGLREWQLRASMLEAMTQENCGVSYEPIVTTHGEVLHNTRYPHELRAGDLVLADVGAETPSGWAGDVTRTWPVSGTYSPTQRALYEVVLASQAAAIAAVRPGARYRDVHLTASRTMAEGLLALGILRGASASELVEQGAHALFFPHGVGHLLGLDVHDMEDLGDRAGYAPGRARSSQFGLSYLRLDRDLAPGMAVTIEPGFYRVPAILGDPRFAGLIARFVDRDALERFEDVRGIRIEDDVLVTEGGSEVLTRAIPKTIDDVERAMRGGR